MDTRLAIGLDFDHSDRDRIMLRTFAPVEPGFLPEGRTLKVQVGHAEWAFKLDEDGRGADGPATVRVRRDRRNPAQWTLALTCRHGDVAGLFVQDGMTNETTPKPGEVLQFPVRVTLDAPVCQPAFEVEYTAKYDRFGKAKGGL